jgi:hypothetical protein
LNWPFLGLLFGFQVYSSMVFSMFKFRFALQSRFPGGKSGSVMGAIIG